MRRPVARGSRLVVAPAWRSYHPRMHREVNVFLLPREFEPDDLSGEVAVVIDVLRATTTIVTALANGARCVIPCGDVEDARRIAGEYSAGDVLLGGERGGVRID